MKVTVKVKVGYVEWKFGISKRSNNQTISQRRPKL